VQAASPKEEEMAKKVIVKQDEAKPVPVEVLAASIKAIAEGTRKLLDGPLNEKALLLLIQHAAPAVGGRYSNSKVGITEIKAVLEGMASLETAYLKKPAKT
jgi:hypothetical protein